MSHAFLSYVKDDFQTAKYVADILSANGVQVWLDTTDLRPGIPWRDQLRHAIEGGNFFIPFFSKAWLARSRTFANQELDWAIDELALRPHNCAWCIPFVLEGGTVPDRSIGGGRKLDDFQYLSVTKLGWQEALRRLLKELGIAEPILDSGEPLAPGLPSTLKLTKGNFTIDQIEPHMPVLRNLEFQLTSGEIKRDERGLITARVNSRSPNTQLQELNEQLGFSHIECVSSDKEISKSRKSPTSFYFSKNYNMPKRTIIPDMLGIQSIGLTVDLPVEVNWEAKGFVDGNDFRGTFIGSLRYPSIEGRWSMRGKFELEFVPALGA